MRKCFVIHGKVAVVIATAWLLVAIPRAESQTKPAAGKPAAVPRTPDGKPDMRGTWTKVGGDLNEANAPRIALTASYDLDAEGNGTSEPAGFTGGPAGRDGTADRPGPRMGQKPQYEPSPAPKVDIVDPADRVLPWRPEAAAARVENAKKMGPPAEGFEYLELSARCAPPAPWYGHDRGSIEILQRPEEVVMLYEWDHASRVIYTDGRPPVGADMRFFGGDARGKWEGDTLVVTTTNLNGWGAWSRIFQRYSTAMRMTERFTMVSPKLINYEVTYDDPNMFTRPIKSVGYLYPSDDDEEVMELSCHEGSRTLYNIFGF